MLRTLHATSLALMLAIVIAGAGLAQSSDPASSASASPEPRTEVQVEAVAEADAEQECRPSAAAQAAEEVAGWAASLQAKLEELREDDVAGAADVESQRAALEQLGRIARTFSWTLSSSSTPAAQANLIERAKAQALKEGDAASVRSKALTENIAEPLVLELPETFAALDAAYQALIAKEPCVGTKLHSLADLKEARNQKVSKAKVLAYLQRVPDWKMRDDTPRAYDPLYIEDTFKTACANRAKGLPKASLDLDQQVGCLWTLASMWDAYRYLDLSDGDPEEAFDALEATYAWATDQVSKKGTRYIDQGLRNLDKARNKPARAKKARKSLDSMLSAPVPPANMAGMHRLLHDVYADTLPLLLPSRQRGFASTVPFSYFQRRNGQTALPGVCELPRDMYPPGCAQPVANAFLAYQTSGDERWYRLANGMRGHILAGNRREYQTYFNERVRCYLKKDSRQC